MFFTGTYLSVGTMSFPQSFCYLIGFRQLRSESHTLTSDLIYAVCVCVYVCMNACARTHTRMHMLGAK